MPDTPPATGPTERPWWQDKATWIGDIENDEDHVTGLHARDVDGEWEYAAVHWSHRLASLAWTVKAGQIVDRPW